jgi:hypothetical protein
MKPTLALLAVFSVACGGSSGESSGLPTAPTAVTLPPAQVEGGQLFTYRTMLNSRVMSHVTSPQVPSRHNVIEFPCGIPTLG